MTMYYSDEMVSLYNGDCREVLACLPSDSLDSCVTDPPYEISFMLKKWDNTGIAYNIALWQEVYRVLKPGAHLLAFGGDRTHHRLMCAIEDAGFEIRTTVTWLYGSGFPKSLDISKSLDRMRDDYDAICKVALWLRPHVERIGFDVVSQHFRFKDETMVRARWTSKSQPVVPRWDQWLELKTLCGFSDDMDVEVWRLNGRKGRPGEAWGEREVIGKEKNWGERGIVPISAYGEWDISLPATAAARAWSGWGTALKPAAEYIVLARKPLSESSVAANVLKWGTGALNIDACRIGTNHWTKKDGKHSGSENGHLQQIAKREAGVVRESNQGRWPSNVILSHASCPVFRLVDQLPSDIMLTIRRYFDGYSRVSALRRGNGNDAFQDTIRAEVLRAQMQDRGEPHQSDKDESGDELSSVSGDVSSSPLVGKERAAEVLQPQVQRSILQDLYGAESCALRQASHEENKGQDFTNQDGAGRRIEDGEASGMEGRGPYSQGVSFGDDCDLAERRSGFSTSDDHGQLHLRASSSDGQEVKAASPENGNSSPHRRRRVKQSSVESGNSRDAQALTRASGNPQSDSWTETREQCLEVLACDIPSEWLCYFEPTGEDLGCQRVGERRVKAIKAGCKEPERKQNPLESAKGMYTEGRKQNAFDYADASGHETVDAWVCVEGCPVAELDRQSGDRPSGGANGQRRASQNVCMSGSNYEREKRDGREPDSGGASRFFHIAEWSDEDFLVPFIYQAKASRAERDKGLESAPTLTMNRVNAGGLEYDPRWGPTQVKNNHPTVKPIKLLQYLIRLVTPKGGTTLDPFCGSGSSLRAAELEGFKIVGIEMGEENCKIAAGRVTGNIPPLFRPLSTPDAERS